VRCDQRLVAPPLLDDPDRLLLRLCFVDALLPLPVAVAPDEPWPDPAMLPSPDIPPPLPVDEEPPLIPVPLPPVPVPPPAPPPDCAIADVANIRAPAARAAVPICFNIMSSHPVRWMRASGTHRTNQISVTYIIGR
jgi:hypothetical protein